MNAICNESNFPCAHCHFVLALYQSCSCGSAVASAAPEGRLLVRILGFSAKSFFFCSKLFLLSILSTTCMKNSFQLLRGKWKFSEQTALSPHWWTLRRAVTVKTKEITVDNQNERNRTVCAHSPIGVMLMNLLRGLECPVSIVKPAGKIHQWTIYFGRWGFGRFEVECSRSARRFCSVGLSPGISRGVHSIWFCSCNFSQKSRILEIRL